MNNKEASSLAYESANSHLRIMSGCDEERGLISTVTGSEPLATEAATRVLISAKQGVKNVPDVQQMYWCFNRRVTEPRGDWKGSQRRFIRSIDSHSCD